jgi:hypothetical protein
MIWNSKPWKSEDQVRWAQALDSDLSLKPDQAQIVG